MAAGWERTPRRRPPPWLATAAIAALLLVAVVRWVDPGPGGSLEILDERSPASGALDPAGDSAPGDTAPADPASDEVAGSSTAAVTWIGVPDPPVTWIRAPSMVWTGRVVLAWGAVLDGEAGAAFDPASRTWRTLPEAPISAREGHVAVWAPAAGEVVGGGEMIVWGGRSLFEGPGAATTGAAYDPVTERWRRIAPGPVVAGSGAHAVWTGRHMVVAAGAGSVGSSDPAVTAYDPVADSWQALPEVPSGSWVDGLATGRGEVFALLGRPGRQPLVPAAGWHQALDAWDPIPPAPIGSASRPAAIGTSWGPVLWVRGLDGTGRLLLFTPGTGRWSVSGPAPLTDRTSPRLAFTGRHVVVWGGSDVRGSLADGALYDLVERRWQHVPAGRMAVPRPLEVVWAGRELIVVGYRARGRQGVVASSFAPLPLAP